MQATMTTLLVLLPSYYNSSHPLISSWYWDTHTPGSALINRNTSFLYIMWSSQRDNESLWAPSLTRGSCWVSPTLHNGTELKLKQSIQSTPDISGRHFTEVNLVLREMLQINLNRKCRGKNVVSTFKNRDFEITRIYILMHLHDWYLYIVRSPLCEPSLSCEQTADITTLHYNLSSTDRTALIIECAPKKQKCLSLLFSTHFAHTVEQNKNLDVSTPRRNRRVFVAYLVLLSRASIQLCRPTMRARGVMKCCSAATRTIGLECAAHSFTRPSNDSEQMFSYCSL